MPWIVREKGPGKASKKMASAKQKNERSDRARVVRAHRSACLQAAPSWSAKATSQEIECHHWSRIKRYMGHYIRLYFAEGT